MWFFHIQPPLEFIIEIGGFLLMFLGIATTAKVKYRQWVFHVNWPDSINRFYRFRVYFSVLVNNHLLIPIIHHYVASTESCTNNQSAKVRPSSIWRIPNAEQNTESSMWRGIERRWESTALCPNWSWKDQRGSSHHPASHQQTHQHGWNHQS